jgi:TolB-like protein
MSLYNELKRRNVFRVAIAYLAGAWLLIEVTETLFPIYGLSDATIRLVVTLLAIGFPILLIFSWVFELTPEGLKLEKDIDRSVSVTHHTGKKLDRTIIVLLALALGYFAFDKFVLEPARDAELVEETAQQTRSHVLLESFGDNSIAVLPFVNMSSDPEQEYFSDGMSEELLNLLSKIPGLRVISRSSSFTFKGKDIDIPTIAAQLNVAYILEGSVRKAGNQVRITAQLIEARSDTHLWSETYDRNLEDIFAIQDEISGQIVGELKIALGTGEHEVISHAQKPTDNLEAYELFLRGRYLWQRRGKDNILHAIDLFEQATELDPQFARAWSSLAATHFTLPTYSAAPTSEHYPLAASAAQKALTQDDSLAEAYAVLGGLADVDKRWAEGEMLYLRAIASEPMDSTAHLWYGEHLMELGRLHEGLEETLIAYQLDPLHPATNVNLGMIYFYLNDTSNALKYGAAAWDLGHWGGLYVQAWVNLRIGEFDLAIRLAEQFYKSLAEVVDNPQIPLLSKMLIEANVDAAKRPLFLEMLTEHETPRAFWILLPGYVGFDQINDAYRVANMASDSESPYSGKWFYLWRPDIAPFRQDPRFAKFVAELGMVDYWREYGWPDVCQPEGDSVICE